jgi:hypothetical protein
MIASARRPRAESCLPISHETLETRARAFLNSELHGTEWSPDSPKKVASASLFVAPSDTGREALLLRLLLVRCGALVASTIHFGTHFL